MTWADPDASMNAAVAGVGPNMKGVVPCSAAQLLPDVGRQGIEGGLCAESRAPASRRVGLGSTATTRSWPRSTSVAMAASPIGPASEHGDAVTRSHVGLVGGVHADGERLGEGGHLERQVVGNMVEPAAIGFGDQEERGQSALGGTVPDPPELVVARLDHDPVADAAVATSAPTRSTTPAISWPRHIGAPPGPASPPILM